jgi:hypothetical protein
MSTDNPSPQHTNWALSIHQNRHAHKPRLHTHARTRTQHTPLSRSLALYFCNTRNQGVKKQKAPSGSKSRKRKLFLWREVVQRGRELCNNWGPGLCWGQTAATDPHQVGNAKHAGEPGILGATYCRTTTRAGAVCQSAARCMTHIT